MRIDTALESDMLFCDPYTDIVSEDAMEMG